jgi:cyclohexyl-isocyanide hydratase
MPNPNFPQLGTNATPKNVVFVLYNAVTLMDFVGATEVFNNAPNFVIHWLAPTMNAITTSENMQVLPTGTFEDIPDTIEILFIPGGNYKGVASSMFDVHYRNFIAEASTTAVWTGSVCTGAFILAAAGGLTNCIATTYWSQLGNLALLNQKLGITVAPGYPRFLVDEETKRFSGGGISSSVDLALQLVQVIADKETAEKAQLFIQYAPKPPNRSGDPSQAPIAITKELTTIEAEYTLHIKQAVLQFINEE